MWDKLTKFLTNILTRNKMTDNILIALVLFLRVIVIAIFCYIVFVLDYSGWWFILCFAFLEIVGYSVSEIPNKTTNKK